jgi:hypothetical protein
MLTLRGVLLTAIVTASAALGTACYDEPEGPPPAYADAEDTYEPQYYDGYVVYYDDGGRPYYHVNGGVFWVPVESPHYVILVNHWRLHGPAYHRWYVRHGYRYRGYRGGRGHRR